MTNRFANLDGTKLIKDEFTKINTGFDGVEAELDAHLADFAKLQAARNGINSNALINPNFTIAQRGTSFTGNGIYTLDRWVMSHGGGAATVTQQSVTPGDAFTPFTHFLRFSQTTAGVSNPNLIQRIESVYTFAGQDVSVSFKARALSGGPYSVDVYFAQNFGTGGAPSAEVLTLVGNVSITTVAQEFELSVTLPSILGKTLGTAGNDNLRLFFNFPVGATFDFDFAYISVNVGNIAQPYQPRSFVEELSLCQRYYEIFRQPVLCWSNGFSKRLLGFKYLTQKRTTPTITITSVKNSESGADVATTFTPTFPNEKSVELISVTDDTLVTAGYSYLIIVSIDAEL